VVAGAPLPAPPDPGAAGVHEAARLLRAGGAGTREAARALAERFGLSRNDAYRAAQDAAAPDPAEDAEPAAEDVCRDVTMPD